MSESDGLSPKDWERIEVAVIAALHREQLKARLGGAPKVWRDLLDKVHRLNQQRSTEREGNGAAPGQYTEVDHRRYAAILRNITASTERQENR